MIIDLWQNHVSVIMAVAADGLVPLGVTTLTDTVMAKCRTTTHSWIKMDPTNASLALRQMLRLLHGHEISRGKYAKIELMIVTNNISNITTTEQMNLCTNFLGILLNENNPFRFLKSPGLRYYPARHLQEPKDNDLFKNDVWFPVFICSSPPRCIMMTSSNGNIFRATGPMWGEFTGHKWIPLKKVSDAELWYFLWFTSEQTIE